VYIDDFNANLNSIETTANALYQKNPEIEVKYENMKRLINDSKKGKQYRTLDQSVRNAACDYRNAVLKNSNALDEKSLGNILTRLNPFIFKQILEDFHKTSTLAYTPPELLSGRLTEFQLTQPQEAAKSRDLYAYGMSLFQMTHPISNDVLEQRFVADIEKEAKNLGVDIKQNIETIIHETNEKQKEFIIKSVGDKCKSDEIPRLKEIGITSDNYKEILSEKSYSELNEIYKLIAPKEVIIKDYKQKKEDLKLVILPEMAKEFVNNSKNHPPPKGSSDEIMLKLLSDDPQKRGTVKDTLKMLDKLDFRVSKP
jgi:serine/threonine protein kinase